MPEAWGLFAAASLLLLVAGAPKIVRPMSTLDAARDLRLPFISAGLVRAFGAVEVAVAIVALVVGGRVCAALLGAFYVVFAGLVTKAFISKDVASCGCFAGSDSPPSILHAAIDVGLAVSAFLVAVSGAPSIAAIVSHEGLGKTGAALAAGIVVAGLSYLAMVRFPYLSDPLADWPDSDRRDLGAEVHA